MLGDRAREMVMLARNSDGIAENWLHSITGPLKRVRKTIIIRLVQEAAMIEPSYTDENARAILSIFRDEGVQAGDVLLADALYLAFLRNPNHRAEDYAAGLRRASEKGWLMDEGNIVRLTETGSKEL